jgi:hypothetical protein
MNWLKIAGYSIAVSGLGILGWNAYLYLTGNTVDKTTAGAGILLCVTGAFLVRRATYKTE